MANKGTISRRLKRFYTFYLIKMLTFFAKIKKNDDKNDDDDDVFHDSFAKRQSRSRSNVRENFCQIYQRSFVIDNHALSWTRGSLHGGRVPIGRMREVGRRDTKHIDITRCTKIYFNTTSSACTLR